MLNRITLAALLKIGYKGSEAEISWEPIIIQARENGGLGQEGGSERLRRGWLLAILFTAIFPVPRKVPVTWEVINKYLLNK